MSVNSAMSNSKYSKDFLGREPNANCFIKPKVKEQMGTDYVCKESLYSARSQNPSHSSIRCVLFR